jgi:hypothetical protein
MSTETFVSNLMYQDVGIAVEDIPLDEYPRSFVHTPQMSTTKRPPKINTEGLNLLQILHATLDCRSDGLGCNLRGCTLQPAAPDAKLTEITGLPEGFTS